MGTCEGYAGEVAQQALATGSPPATVLALDSLLEHPDRVKLVREASAVVIITSSYNGLPPDNAVAFVAFLEKEKDAAAELFRGVKVSVFG